MKILVLGDIHGNLIALEEVVKKYFNEVDQVICHGDVVNYGPWSNECVDLLATNEVICLKGNHEEAYLLGHYPINNELVKQFFNHTYKNFDRIKEIKAYKESFKTENLLVKHTLNNKYYYPDSDFSNIKLKSNTVIGHSHYPFISRIGEFNFVNTGSVGQNRLNLSIINFTIYDDVVNEFEIINLKYDPKYLINEMKVSNYPEDCLKYYKSKLR